MICYKNPKNTRVKSTMLFQILNREGEIGYWIGVAFWGQGLIPEAVNKIIQYAFERFLKTDLLAYYRKETGKK